MGLPPNVRLTASPTCDRKAALFAIAGFSELRVVVGARLTLMLNLGLVLIAREDVREDWNLCPFRLHWSIEKDLRGSPATEMVGLVLPLRCATLRPLPDRSPGVVAAISKPSGLSSTIISNTSVRLPHDK